MSFSERNATVNVKTKAIMQYTGLIDENAVERLSSLISSKMNPPIIIGTERRKLYSADFSSLFPERIRELIVLPDREIPGSTANP